MLMLLVLILTGLSFALVILGIAEMVPTVQISMSVPQTRTTVMPMPRVPILLDLSLAHATQAIQAMAVTVKTLMSVQLVRMIVIQTQPAQTAMVRLHVFVTPGTAEMVPIVKT